MDKYNSQSPIADRGFAVANSLGLGSSLMQCNVESLETASLNGSWIPAAKRMRNPRVPLIVPTRVHFDYTCANGARLSHVEDPAPPAVAAS